MVAQLAGAVVRAIFVFIIVSTPSLLVPGSDDGAHQAVMLVALFASLFVFSEYAATYPTLIEFRDAPPYNRLRIVALFVTLFFFGICVRPVEDGTTLQMILNAMGLIAHHAVDGAASPATLLIMLLPETVSPVQLLHVRVLTGLGLVVALVTITIFVVTVRLQDWPRNGHVFNVWVNLPTFDAYGNTDVVHRIVRDARVNTILGLLMPFVIPIVAGLMARHLDLSPLASSHTLVWVMALWVFLPVSLVMRGVAMIRLARMIEARRAQLALDAELKGAARA